jgi:mRNA interferase HicA
VIKRRDLLRHLGRHGCRRLRQGGRHEVWTNAAGELRSTVPRHRELPLGTARAICAQLGVPPLGR